MTSSHLLDLRAELARLGLDGFIVPRADEHLGEYVPPGAERLAWLTGFTGSAGLAVVLPARAALFVDGRYVLQAAAQTDPALWERRHVTEEPPAAWLAEAAPGARIGYDPWLISEEALQRFTDAGVAMVATEKNPIDAIWSDRPPPPLGPARPHPLALCRPQFAAEARRHRGGAAHGQARRGGADRSGVAGVAAQHPRRRRAVHPVRAGVRDHRGGCVGGAVHGPAQAAGGDADVARQRRRGAGTGRAAGGAGVVRRQAGAGRSGQLAGVVRADAAGGRRAGGGGDGPVAAAEGVQERDRAAGRARGPHRATRRRSAASCTGWKAPPAMRRKWRRRRGCWHSGRRYRGSAAKVLPPFPPPASMARSCITGSTQRATGRSDPTNFS